MRIGFQENCDFLRTRIQDIGSVETPYSFTTPAALVADFWRDVDLLKEPK